MHDDVSGHHLLGISNCDLQRCMSSNSTEVTFTGCTTPRNIKGNGQIIPGFRSGFGFGFRSPENVIICFSSQKCHENHPRTSCRQTNQPTNK